MRRLYLALVCVISILSSGNIGAINIKLEAMASSVQIDLSETKQAEDNSNTGKMNAVDLGLSVKWASCNVGAESPEDYGGYYAWGETDEKDYYGWGTYKWCNGGGYSMTKYCADSNCGEIDNNRTIDLSDDVAHVKWGGKWRMPTLDELKELKENCDWEWFTLNEINGYRVTGPNGNSIFLPATGYRSGTDVDDSRGRYGRYWSSTLNSGFSSHAYYLDFYVGNYSDSNISRYFGFSVRSVWDEKIRDNTSVITVATKDVTGITHGGAKLSGTVNGSSQSLPCGFIYGTTSTLSSTSGLRKNITSNGGYSISVTELKENTIYYYRAYAIVDGVYKYGEVKSFTTKEAEDNSNTDKKEAVDLGLSVKWASCNVGAKSPEDYGGYYAWGEIEGKDFYNWYTYKWCNDSYNSLTKYCIDSELGKVDKKKTLDLSDDVAHMKWGGKWRIPTSEELRELVDNCNWERARVNGVYGYRVIGPNGNSIFLPAAGYCFDAIDYYRGSFGYYWSATLGSVGIYGSDVAYYLQFYNDCDVYKSGNRSLGYTIRPVTD